jgi:hypothetical protein
MKQALSNLFHLIPPETYLQSDCVSKQESVRHQLIAQGLIQDAVHKKISTKTRG